MREFHSSETLPQLIERADLNVPNSPRRLARLFRRYPARAVWATFVFVNSFISIAIIAVAAMLVDTTLIFPSLGPTAFLFFYRPMDSIACPRNAICGHGIGILCGYAALVLFGLHHHASVEVEGVTTLRIFCAGLALGTTCALMILFNLVHPPAASTPLLIALGSVTEPSHLIVLEIAVVALTVQGILINRAEGLDIPLWGPRQIKNLSQ